MKMKLLGIVGERFCTRQVSLLRNQYCIKEYTYFVFAACNAELAYSVCFSSTY